MSRPVIELDLPLGDRAGGELAVRRVEHLRGVAGVDEQTLVRLARAFPSLRAIYAAPDAELERVVGTVTAARIRWFLDAPLETGLIGAPQRVKPRVIPKAA
ncbi:MAG TPA: hypothetical protein VJU79_08665 [Candidatus Dormibacteraeota bacterium]|nr:hypothetical protein [Candidatus Dormibacteraeota bacterium]